MRIHRFLIIAVILITAGPGCQNEPEIAEVTPTNPAQMSLSDPTERPTYEVALPLVAGNKTPSYPIYEPTSVPTPSPKPSSTPPPLPTLTPTPNYPVYNGPTIDREDIGVQIHLHREDLSQLMYHLETLGVGWVKVQVSWKLFEPQPGVYDSFLFEELDRLVEEAVKRDIKVLLGVAKAPEWSRPTTELDGPPSDYRLFESFMNALAARYAGHVAAYELWNEPNLVREWNGFPLNPASLVDLIRFGATGVRAADPDAIIISAAPATTGINDGVNAIDDRVYLQQMVNAGILDVVDAVGAHPYGWANPPDSRASNPDPSVPSHNNHPSFFYLDTLEDYHQILLQAGYSDKPIWVTEFGWGSYDGMGVKPPPGVEYMDHVNEIQQATYTIRAYEIARERDWVGPLILWNLNFAPTFGSDFVESAYSLLRPDGTPRPVYHSLRTLSS